MYELPARFLHRFVIAVVLVVPMSKQSFSQGRAVYNQITVRTWQYLAVGFE